MWLTPKDYFDFAKNCGIVYFQFDLPELLDELYNDIQVLDGITFDDLHEFLMRYYNELITYCPEGTTVEQYLDEELCEDFPLLRKVLLAIHKSFLDN